MDIITNVNSGVWHGDVVETAILNVKMSSSNVWFCPLCEWFAGASMKAVVRHIGANHAHEAGFHICCGIDGCPRTYKKFDSYRHHLYQIHRDVLDVSSVCYNADPEEQGGSNPEEQGGSNPEDSMEDYCDSDPNVQSDFYNSFPLTLKQVGLFLLKAKEIYKVAETHLGSLMQDIHNSNPPSLTPLSHTPFPSIQYFYVHPCFCHILDDALFIGFTVRQQIRKLLNDGDISNGDIDLFYSAVRLFYTTAATYSPVILRRKGGQP